MTGEEFWRQRFSTGQALVGRFPSFARRAADFEPAVRAKGEAPTEPEASLCIVDEHCSPARELCPPFTLQTSNLPRRDRGVVPRTPLPVPSWPSTPPSTAARHELSAGGGTLGLPVLQPARAETHSQ